MILTFIGESFKTYYLKIRSIPSGKFYKILNRKNDILSKTTSKFYVQWDIPLCSNFCERTELNFETIISNCRLQLSLY